MRRSLLLRSLEGRTRDLRSRFLPRNFSPTGAYSSAALENAAIYMFLFHAELETYLEDIALRSTETAIARLNAGEFDRWSASMGLAAFGRGTNGVRSAPSSAAEFEARDYTYSRIIFALNQHKLKINSNNGVGQKHLLHMFVPIGVNELEIDPDLLIDLDSVSQKRGEIAHRGVSRFSLLPDPREFRQLSYKVIEKLKEFEKIIPNFSPSIN